MLISLSGHLGIPISTSNEVGHVSNSARSSVGNKVSGHRGIDFGFLLQGRGTTLGATGDRAAFFHAETAGRIIDGSEQSFPIHLLHGYLRQT